MRNFTSMHLIMTTVALTIVATAVTCLLWKATREAFSRP